MVHMSGEQLMLNIEFCVSYAMSTDLVLLESELLRSKEWLLLTPCPLWEFILGIYFMYIWEFILLEWFSKTRILKLFYKGLSYCTEKHMSDAFFFPLKSFLMIRHLLNHILSIHILKNDAEVQVVHT